MNENTVKGKWELLKGKLRTKWSELTDNNLNEIEEDHQLLSFYLVKHYGLEEEQATAEAKNFFNRQAQNAEKVLNNKK